MSSAGPTSSARPLQLSQRSLWTARLADYVELTKPRIAVMALITVAVGYTLAGSETWNLAGLLHSLLGIGLTAAASSAINQWMERHTDALMQRTARPVEPSAIEPLTGREQEILTLVARGMTNPQIAEQLVISTSTVQFHVHNILGKLGVGTRTEAVAIAIQSRLVET